MELIAIRSGLIAVVTASLVFVIPTVSPGVGPTLSPLEPRVDKLCGFQGGFQDPEDYSPGEEPVPPVAESGDSNTYLQDLCHYSVRSNAGQFSRHYRDGALIWEFPNPWPGDPPGYANLKDEVRARDASLRSRIEILGGSDNSDLFGLASLGWLPREESPGGETCCHGVVEGFWWNGTSDGEHISFADSAFPAVASFNLGTALDPIYIVAYFTATGCPPLGIPGIVKRARTLWWVTIVITREDVDDVPSVSVEGEQEISTPPANQDFPPLAYTPIDPATVEDETENLFGGAVSVTFVFTRMCMMDEDHIFCFATSLEWQTGVDVAVETTEESRAFLDHVTKANARTRLHDFQGGENYFPPIDPFIWGAPE